MRLSQDIIAKLAFEAELRDIRIGELIGALIAATMEKDLLPLILDTEKDTKTCKRWLEQKLRAHA